MPVAHDSRLRSRTFKPADQIRALAIIFREEFGAPFRFYDAATGLPADASESAGGSAEWQAAWPIDDPAAVREVAAGGRAKARPARGNRYHLALPIFEADGGAPTLVASGAIAAIARDPGDAAVELARTEKWALSVQERVRMATSQRARRHDGGAADGQLTLAWNAVMAMDELMRCVRVHKDPAKDRARVLRLAAEVLGAQAVAWVPAQADAGIVIEGEKVLSAWDFGQLADLLVADDSWEKAGYLAVTDARRTDWGVRFPRVENLLAVPLTRKSPMGWLFAINKSEPASTSSGGRSPSGFRKPEAAVLAAFAAALGLQVRSSQRYHQLKVLLVGLTRSLTAAIDAKDSYTYGHSERVARVAVELGRELGLPEDEQSDIYLGGLLHDIGKIGVSDAVLGKREALTPEEFDQIRQHVKIGYRILADLKPIAHLLPGVLYHHEQLDGSGYPEGLKGEAIPFIARVIAVADGYDAMSTSRPYRTAMPPAKVEEVLKEGAGRQWDARIVDAFFRCRDRIHAIRQRGVGDSLCTALDGALRNGRTLGGRSGHGEGTDETMFG